MLPPHRLGLPSRLECLLQAVHPTAACQLMPPAFLDSAAEAWRQQLGPYAHVAHEACWAAQALLQHSTAFSLRSSGRLLSVTLKPVEVHPPAWHEGTYGRAVGGRVSLHLKNGEEDEGHRQLEANLLLVPCPRRCGQHLVIQGGLRSLPLCAEMGSNCILVAEDSKTKCLVRPPAWMQQELPVQAVRMTPALLRSHPTSCTLELPVQGGGKKSQFGLLSVLQALLALPSDTRCAEWFETELIACWRFQLSLQEASMQDCAWEMATCLSQQ
ncbi:unnamed protein product, partial [Symbiodinium sp. CCMP2456]